LEPARLCRRRRSPHLRVENRVLPAGPSVADVLANAAFYYGLLRALADSQDPVWTQMPFATAAGNLRDAARYGMDARLFWPQVGEVPAAELVVHHLLPLAREGLRRWDVAGQPVGRAREPSGDPPPKQCGSWQRRRSCAFLPRDSGASARLLTQAEPVPMPRRCTRRGAGGRA
jgi:hypothetical protein